MNSANNVNDRKAKSLLDVALDLASKGYPVFPLKPGSKEPVSSGGFHIATNDPDQIRRWWKRNPNYNIGIAAPELLVIDLDTEGFDAFVAKNKAKLFGDFVPPEIPAVRTASGGYHYYMRVDPNWAAEWEIGNNIRVFPGIDLKGCGKGYVVAPPSVVGDNQYHLAGGWAELPRLAEIPMIPEQTKQAIEKAIARNKKPRNNGAEPIAPPPSCSIENTDEFLTELKAALPDIWLVGRRHVLALHVAGILRKLGIPEDIAAATILDVAEACWDEEIAERERAVRDTYAKDISEIAGFSGLTETEQAALKRLLDKSTKPHHNHRKTTSNNTPPRNGSTNSESDELAALEKTLNAMGGAITKFIPRHYSRLILQEHRFVAWGDLSTGDFLRYDADEGIWRDDAEGFIANLLRDSNLLPEEWKTHNRILEIIRDIQQWCWQTTPMPEPPLTLIPFANGVLDLDTGTLRPYQPEDWFRSKLQWTYDPSANSTILARRLAAFPQEIQIHFLELLAYCLWRAYPYQRFFAWIGSGRNGKSYLMKILMKALDKRNISHIGLHALGEDKFAMVQLHGKLLNLCGELCYNDISNSDALKALTGGDFITADRKYKSPITFQNHAKILFAGNSLPVTRDTTDAFFRRAYVVEFTHKFQEDPRIENELDLMPAQDQAEEFSWLLTQAVGVLQALRARGFIFSNDLPIEVKRERYQTMSHPLRQFIAECCRVTRHADDYIYKWEFMERLNEWLEQRGLNAYTETRLGREMREVLGFEDAQRGEKRWRAWVGIRWREGGDEGDDVDDETLPNTAPRERTEGEDAAMGDGSRTGFTGFTPFLQPHIATHEPVSKPCEPCEPCEPALTETYGLRSEYSPDTSSRDDCVGRETYQPNSLRREQITEAVRELLSRSPQTIEGLSKSLRLDIRQVRRGLSVLVEREEATADDDGYWWSVGLDAQRRRVLELLRGGAKRLETLEKLGVSDARRIVLRLQSDGYVKEVEGQYLLSDAGKRVVGATKGVENLEL